MYVRFDTKHLIQISKGLCRFHSPSRDLMQVLLLYEMVQCDLVDTAELPVLYLWFGVRQLRQILCQNNFSKTSYALNQIIQVYWTPQFPIEAFLSKLSYNSRNLEDFSRKKVSSQEFKSLIMKIFFLSFFDKYKSKQQRLNYVYSSNMPQCFIYI